MYKGCGCSFAVGGSLPGDMIFQVAVGNFCVVHHGPAKRPFTRPHCWTWTQPPWAILTPNPHNLHLNSLLLLSLHFRSLLCQTKTEAGGQLGAGSPWADWIYSHHFLLLETRGIGQLFRKRWPTLHLMGGWRSVLQISRSEKLAIHSPSPPWNQALPFSSCGHFFLQMNSESWFSANQCNKSLLPADAPCGQLHPAPGQDNADESSQMGENKKSPNNFAIPVLSLEHFCCSLQAQNPGNALGGAKGNSGFSHAGITLPQQT